MDVIRELIQVDDVIESIIIGVQGALKGELELALLVFIEISLAWCLHDQTIIIGLRLLKGFKVRT